MLNIEWSFAPGQFSALFGPRWGLFFFGLIIMQATLAFWTTETLEIMNTLTSGGVESAQYPMPSTTLPFAVSTLVVPLACVSYFPVVGVCGRDPWAHPGGFST